MPTSMNDPRTLRAIAHPVRNRILNELQAFASMRAADVAVTLGIPANQASFHLRQLAKYGLVEEDPAAARDKRDRVWRLADPSGTAVSLKQVEDAPGGKAASAVFRRTKAAWSHHVIDVAYGDDRESGIIRSVSENAVRLTVDEAEELNLEMQAMVERWAERTRKPSAPADDADRRTYLVFQIVMPYPRDAVAGSDGAGGG